MNNKQIFLVALLVFSVVADNQVAFDGKVFADWESTTGIEATEPGSDKKIEGITFSEITTGNAPGILTQEITPDPEAPHYSLEFEYMGRGQIIEWKTQPTLAKLVYAMQPFRENWQIRGPTEFEWDMKQTGTHYQFVCAPKKLDVNSQASVSTLHLDNMSIQFAPGFFAFHLWTNNNAKTISQQNVNQPIGQFNNFKVYINPETDIAEITTSYGNAKLVAQYPAGYFAAHPYCSFKTQVPQIQTFKSMTVRGVNEYRMTPQVPWLKKRDDWKLQGVPTKFQWESDNRDCYFVCSENNGWPIDPNNGPFLIFYGWDNTKSEIRDRGKTVVSSNHRLPTFKLGLFYEYSISIDPNTSVLTATSSAGLSFSHTFPANYFNERPWCTFGVWPGMQGLTIRNIRRDAKENAIKKNNFRGLKVGVVVAEKFYELLSPKFELPVDEWVRVSIRFSPTYSLAIPAVEASPFKVSITDFGGDPTIEEVPLPGDFVVRRVVLKATDELYCVPANDLQNFFITGFGVDYSTSGDPIEVNLKERTIKVIGGGSNAVLAGDILFSADSAQSAISTAQDDILIGDDRNNVFEGGPGADRIDGQAGSDTVSYLHANSGVEVSLESGKGYTGQAKGDVLISIENIIGSEFDDVLISSKEGGYIDGRGGTNTIVTGGGKDTVKLGAGVDTIHVHNSQKILYVLDFEGDEDHLFLLGAVSEDEISIEEYEKENTMIQLSKSGGQIVLANVLPDELGEKAIIFFEKGQGTDKKCTETATLVNGRCMYNAPAGFWKKENEIVACSDDGCQICNDDKCTACEDDHYNDSQLGCEPCHKNCLTCLGPKETQCSTCVGEQILKGGSCIEKPAECKETEYLDPTKNVCVKDEASCPKGYWGQDDGETSRTCVQDIDGSLQAAYLAKKNPPPPPTKQPKVNNDQEGATKSVSQGECPILYSECDFQGTATEVCKPIPHLEESKIKSIYIPEDFGKTIVLHKLPQFEGKTAKFKKSVQCLDDIDFHILEQYGINVNFDSDQDRLKFFNDLNNESPELLQIDLEDNQINIQEIQLPKK